MEVQSRGISVGDYNVALQFEDRALWSYATIYLKRLRSAVACRSTHDAVQVDVGLYYIVVVITWQYSTVSYSAETYYNDTRISTWPSIRLQDWK